MPCFWVTVTGICPKRTPKAPRTSRGDAQMKVIYITSTLPFGEGEPFLYPEIDALRLSGVNLKVVPMHPRGTPVHSEAQSVLPLTEAEPLVSARILVSAFRIFLRFPKRALRALFLSSNSESSPLAKKPGGLPKGTLASTTGHRWGQVISMPTGQPPPRPWLW